MEVVGGGSQIVIEMPPICIASEGELVVVG